MLRVVNSLARGEPEDSALALENQHGDRGRHFIEFCA